MECKNCGHVNGNHGPITMQKVTEPFRAMPQKVEKPVAAVGYEKWACENCGRFHFSDGSLYSNPFMKIGDKIKFDGERQRYTLQAFDERFFILTKPFNVRNTYLYTMVDLKRRVRGPSNFVFDCCENVDGPEGALKYLKMMQNERMNVSYRNYRKLTENELKIFGA